jgi:hypothetical protein
MSWLHAMSFKAAKSPHASPSRGRHGPHLSPEFCPPIARGASRRQAAHPSLVQSYTTPTYVNFSTRRIHTRLPSPNLLVTSKCCISGGQTLQMAGVRLSAVRSIESSREVSGCIDRGTTAGCMRGRVQSAKQHYRYRESAMSIMACEFRVTLILWCEENAIANSVHLLVDLLFLQEQI